MSLLDKFSAVEIKADTRISEEDRDFCQRHQKAYLDARAALKSIKKQWKEIYDAQMVAMEGIAESEYTRERYIKHQRHQDTSSSFVQTAHGRCRGASPRIVPRFCGYGAFLFSVPFQSQR